MWNIIELYCNYRITAKPPNTASLFIATHPPIQPLSFKSLILFKCLFWVV